jgi:ribonuclease-3
MQKFQTLLGYTFQDPAILVQALTHNSIDGKNNERLEFLGDSILNFVAAEMLYDRYPRLPEGELSRLRAGMISEVALAKLALRLSLPEVLRYSAQQLRPQPQASMCADAMEAVFAAVYKDSGLETARTVITKHLTDMMSNGEARLTKDAKTALQEYLQGRGLARPFYELLKSPRSHAGSLFEVTCTAADLKIVMRAAGPTRKEAEQAAAQKTLQACRSHS